MLFLAAVYLDAAHIAQAGPAVAGLCVPAITAEALTPRQAEGGAHPGAALGGDTPPLADAPQAAPIMTSQAAPMTTSQAAAMVTSQAAPVLAGLALAAQPGAPAVGMVAGGPAAASAAPAADAAAPATTDAPATDGGDALAVRDPWEKTNRAMWRFDMAMDRVALAPVAHAYVKVVPHVLRDGIHNVLDNLDEPFTAGNDILQLHFGKAVRSIARIVLNTTVGIGGLFDVARRNGLPRHYSDFGQTLGRYGVKPGPYVVFPFFGPANVRDGFGELVDNVGDPVGWVLGNFTTTFGASRDGAWVVDWRAHNDATLKAINEATDPYAFARSGYMQHRSSVVQEATGKSEALPDFDSPADAGAAPSGK